MKHILILCLIIMITMPLLADVSFPRPDFNPFKVNSVPGLKMSHSMGFEAGTSSSGLGYYMSRYTNHLKYSLNPKLELDLDLNFVNYGSMNTNSKFSLNDDNANRMIPEFALRYRPTDSILIEVQMGQGMQQRLRPWYER
ncbi:MAG TPA: hypothetical protein PKI59_02385 [Candidatus Cloacimonadota bacterium]|nr:hypothetical protein [Candidatus Cloacimonadota bacterium]